MSMPIPTEPEDSTDPVVTETPAPVPAPESAHPDPITGEPGAHPVGVGVGALGAGAAGAAIGSIGGPIGMLIGAAIGAVAGGLAGKEVAATHDTPVAEEEVAAEEPFADASTPISMGSVPGEGLRAIGGSGFADDEGLLSTGTTGVTAATPTPAHSDSSGATGFQAPPLSETAPLAETAMPHSGEEAVKVSAYYHYVERTTTGEPGDALGDWLAAEREMMLG